MIKRTLFLKVDIIQNILRTSTLNCSTPDNLRGVHDIIISNKFYYDYKMKIILIVRLNINVCD